MWHITRTPLKELDAGYQLRKARASARHVSWHGETSRGSILVVATMRGAVITVSQHGETSIWHVEARTSCTTIPLMAIIASRPFDNSFVCLRAGKQHSMAVASPNHLPRASQRTASSHRGGERIAHATMQLVCALGGSQIFELLGALRAQTEWVKAEVTRLVVEPDAPLLAATKGRVEREDGEDLDDGNHDDHRWPERL